MDDKAFAREADATLAQIEAALEAAEDAVDAGMDFERVVGGILEIEFADGSKIVINRQAAVRELWVAARAGGYHFRWDGGLWRDTRDGEELMARLSALVSGQAGTRVVLA